MALLSQNPRRFSIRAKRIQGTKHCDSSIRAELSSALVIGQLVRSWSDLGARPLDHSFLLVAVHRNFGRASTPHGTSIPTAETLCEGDDARVAITDKLAFNRPVPPILTTRSEPMAMDTLETSFEKECADNQTLTFSTLEKECQLQGIGWQELLKDCGGLTVDGLFTNLAWLLSDQCTHETKIAVFNGLTENQVKSRQIFTGSLLQQLTEVYGYLEGVVRTQSCPAQALRESLINAFLHHDYRYRASILICVYSDQIEMVSLGGLMSGLSIDDLRVGLPMSRNPNLAEVFYQLQFSVGWVQDSRL